MGQNFRGKSESGAKQYNQRHLRSKRNETEFQGESESGAKQYNQRHLRIKGMEQNFRGKVKVELNSITRGI